MNVRNNTLRTSREPLIYSTAAAYFGRNDAIRDMTSRPQNVESSGCTDAAFRLECEARHWLREGYTSRQQVGELIHRIAQRRGEGAAEKLRDEMRRQWSRRADWLEASEP